MEREANLFVLFACDSGQYKSLQSVRQDAELICLNALTFNTVGDEYWFEARHFLQRVDRLFSGHTRVTHKSAYAMEAMDLLGKHPNPVPVAVPKTSASRPAVAKAKAPAVSRKRKIQELKSADSASASDLGQSVDAVKPAEATADVAADVVVEVDNGVTTQLSISRRRAGRPKGSTASSKAVVAPAVPAPLDDAAQPAPDPVRAFSRRTPREPPQSVIGNGPACALRDLEVATKSAMVVKDIDDIAASQQIAFLMVVAEAYQSCAVRHCLRCGSAGSQTHLLMCSDCGEAIHSFCCAGYVGCKVDAPIRIMSPVAASAWKCPNCATCDLCQHSSGPRACSGLIFCNGCHKCYHVGCLSPSAQGPSLDAELLSTSWYCGECVTCDCCSHNSKVVDATSTKTSPVWGLSPDKCIDCVEPVAAPVAVPEPELDDCCSVCKVSSPSDVAGNSGLPLSRDFICADCTKKYKAGRSSHLGRGSEAWELLNSVADVQRARVVQRAAQESAVSEDCDKKLRAMWLSFSPWYCALIAWSESLCRQMWSQEDAALFDVTKQHLGVPRWLFKRATRFHRLCKRRKEDFMPENEIVGIRLVTSFVLPAHHHDRYPPMCRCLERLCRFSLIKLHINDLMCLYKKVHLAAAYLENFGTVAAGRGAAMQMRMRCPGEVVQRLIQALDAQQEKSPSVQFDGKELRALEIRLAVSNIAFARC